jgi:hypothetical protein
VKEVLENLKVRYRRFREWKQQPHEVAPLSEQQHECATCGTHYEGNYCPRCGQSSKIARYSFKNACLLFLDVWGLGNRGMFHSIRDLLLRPGYMIRDYLRGMQMAYFPPFKLFFLLIALSILVDSGMNISGINRYDQEHMKIQVTISADESVAKEEADKTLSAEKRRKLQKRKELASKWYSGEMWKIALEWYYQHISVVWLIALLLFTAPLFLMFRHSPAIPDLRFSECFVAMIYITDMLLIYSTVSSVLCFDDMADMVYGILLLFLFIVPVRQLSGYSYWSTIWRLLVALIPFCIIVILIIVAVFAIWGYIFVNY